MAAISTIALATAATAGVVGAGYSIHAGEQAKNKAEDAAREQAAKAKEQEALIAAEKKKQDSIAGERKRRLAGNELLSGTETGLASNKNPSLLS